MLSSFDTRKRDLTQTALRGVLRYNKATGVLTWLVRRSPIAVPGARAGSKHWTGYRYITVFRKSYPEHHLVWFFVTGVWPREFLDHRNRQRDDNRWANLREASSKQNNENSLVRSDSTSGVRGVSWCSTQSKWRAYIYHNKKQVNLGWFQTKNQAARARLLAERKLHLYSPNQK